MCPDRQIISLYLDGELPSPWKEKMETHLAACQACHAALAGYRNLGESLRDLPGAPQGRDLSRDETVLAAQERVWKKLTAPELVLPAGNEGPAIRPFTSKREGGSVKRLWKTTVTLPLPAAAAAAVIIIAVFLALTGINGRSQPMYQNTMADIVEDQGIFPMQDMNSVLQYLSSQNEGDFMVIRLPESRKFSRIGEPALINAADYSRRSNSR
jgi:anti-sigma factor RsiW